MSHIALKWNIVNVSLCFYQFSSTKHWYVGCCWRPNFKTLKWIFQIFFQNFIPIFFVAATKILFFFLMILSILATILPFSQNGFRDLFLRIMFHFEKKTGVDYEEATNPISLRTILLESTSKINKKRFLVVFWHKRLIKNKF